MMPCRTNSTQGGEPLDDVDLILLRRLSGAGMWLRSGELVGDEGLEHLTEPEIQQRLTTLVADGHVTCFFSATVRGSSHVVRQVHHHRQLRAA